jgi:nicotinate-nucleotide adenylyltransferase
LSASARRAYGVLGGTFDPVHLGHLEIAERVRQALELSRVLFVPSTFPPHKSPSQVTPAHHRAAMVRLALEGRPGLEMSTIELERPGVCYTIDTLRELGRREDGDPVFILGTDALATLHTWREWERLLAEFDLVAIDRPGAELREVARRAAPAIVSRVVHVERLPGSDGVRRLEPGRGGRVIHLPIEPIRISSSEIRRAASAGLGLERLVPAPVARYIQDTRIYSHGPAREHGAEEDRP